MPSDEFRIGLVFSPTRTVSIGVIAGNYKKAYDFMGKIQPLIDDFMKRVRAEAVGKRASDRVDKNVFSGEGQ